MNSDKHRPSTIIDVAKLAGVSPSTISRVLNGTAVVALETEQRVRKAIADLDFFAASGCPAVGDQPHQHDRGSTARNKRFIFPTHAQRHRGSGALRGI